MKIPRSAAGRLPHPAGLALRLLLLGGLVGLGACSVDAPDGTQPAPNVTTFEVGRFDDLPLPPRSDPLGARTDAGGVVARSYRVTGTSPQLVLDFYVSELRDRGWVPGQPVEMIGSGTFRGTWTKDGNELTVSSTNAPTIGQDDGSAQVDSQYSLSLMLAP